MNLTRCKNLWLIAMVSAGQWLLARPILAQDQSNAAPAAVTNSNAAALPEPPGSPIELFRQLLEKDRQEQEQLLTNRPPETRKQILAKVREYKALRPDQCDAKLKAT